LIDIHFRESSKKAVLKQIRIYANCHYRNRKCRGALATKWAHAGHTINLGVKDVNNFKDRKLLHNPNPNVFAKAEAVEKSEVVLIATPAPAAGEVAKLPGDTTGKIIIDAMNIVMGRGPAGFKTTTEAILANTQIRDVVKCFNTTGFNNMQDPVGVWRCSH
jgi:predicted dinucleotide-binding enzyme